MGTPADRRTPLTLGRVQRGSYPNHSKMKTGWKRTVVKAAGQQASLGTSAEDLRAPLLSDYPQNQPERWDWRGKVHWD